MAEFAVLLRRYGVSAIIGDKYAGEWPRARFAEHGIDFEQSARPKSDLYHDFLPLLTARRVELLDLPRLTAQFVGLERRTGRSGKDLIDHMRDAHDDLANAVAGVLVGVDLDRRQPLVKLSDVFANGLAPPLPRHCNMVFAVVAMEGGDVAVVYAGHDKRQPLLYILDAVARPLWRDFFTDATALLWESRSAPVTRTRWRSSPRATSFRCSKKALRGAAWSCDRRRTGLTPRPAWLSPPG